MKTIGIIGGMSWESSAEYYRLLNEGVKARLGPTHSAELVMYSMDFHQAAQLEQEERWGELAKLLVDATGRLERAGADFVIIASNTAHRVAEVVQRSIRLPLLHIAEVTADEAARARKSKVGLLGTRFVVEQDFYAGKFSARGIDVVIPDQKAREFVHDIIFNELCVGNVRLQSRERMKTIILNLQRAGAQAVALACTELPLLVRPEDTPVMLFDTMALHVDRAVALALQT